MRQSLCQILIPTGRYLTRCLAGISCVVLVSCIDGREEFWLAGDGSGRAIIRYTLPASLARSCGGEAGLEEILDEFIRQTPTLTNATRRVSREGERTAVEFQASFKSALDLMNSVRGDSVLASGNLKSTVPPLIGHFDFQRSGLAVELTRTVQPAKALPGAFLMPSSQFNGRRLVYILHLPMVAEASSATRTTDGGRTLIWDQTLQEGLKMPLVIHFKGHVPFPWPLVAGIAAALAGLGCLGFVGVRRLRRSARPPHPPASE